MAKQLTDVVQIQSTARAFAAIRANGTATSHFASAKLVMFSCLSAGTMRIDVICLVFVGEQIYLKMISSKHTSICFRYETRTWKFVECL